MKSHKTILLILVISTHIITGYVAGDRDFFNEELLLKPLPSHHVYVYFQFSTIWETAKRSQTCKSLEIKNYSST